MKKQKILVATTNEGKSVEIIDALADLPFEFIRLSELKKDIKEPEEKEDTIQANSILKAKYYAKQTGLMTIADDGGLFVDALQGWPGVLSARIGNNAEERMSAVLEKMKDVPEKNRTATFHTALTIFDPEENTIFLAESGIPGKILQEPVKLSKSTLKYGYNRFFYVPEVKKTYGEMTPAEKNLVSHRGKALQKIKYYLIKNYGHRHIVAGVGLIIKDGKILLNKRNDPHGPFHEKWEFPGGCVELGEKIATAAARETFEETGYEVEIIKRINYIGVASRIGGKYDYQVYIVPFVCKIIAGDGNFRDAEVMETKWYELNEVLECDLLGDNKSMYRDFLPELKLIIKENNL